MIIRFDEIVTYLVGLLSSFSGIWNYLNLPLVDLYEPTSQVGAIIDSWYDLLMGVLGVGQYSLLYFVIGAGLTLTIFLIVVSFFAKLAQIFKLFSI